MSKSLNAKEVAERFYTALWNLFQMTGVMRLDQDLKDSHSAQISCDPWGTITMVVGPNYNDPYTEADAKPGTIFEFQLWMRELYTPDFPKELRMTLMNGGIRHLSATNLTMVFPGCSLTITMTDSPTPDGIESHNHGKPKLLRHMIPYNYSTDYYVVPVDLAEERPEDWADWNRSIERELEAKAQKAERELGVYRERCEAAARELADYKKPCWVLVPSAVLSSDWPFVRKGSVVADIFETYDQAQNMLDGCTSTSVPYNDQMRDRREVKAMIPVHNVKVIPFDKPGPICYEVEVLGLHKPVTMKVTERVFFTHDKMLEIAQQFPMTYFAAVSPSHVIVPRLERFGIGTKN